MMIYHGLLDIDNSIITSKFKFNDHVVIILVPLKWLSLVFSSRLCSFSSSKWWLSIVSMKKGTRFQRFMGKWHFCLVYLFQMIRHPLVTGYRGSHLDKDISIHLVKESKDIKCCFITII